jgi:hypothetical protein
MPATKVSLLLKAALGFSSGFDARVMLAVVSSDAQARLGSIARETEKRRRNKNENILWAE